MSKMNWTRGYLRPGKAERFFAFLSQHTQRLHVWTVGFTHLIIIIAWDTKGKAKP